MIRKLGVVMSVVAGVCLGPLSTNSPAAEPTAVSASLRAKAQAQGRVRVIVELRGAAGRGGEARLRRLQRKVVDATLGPGVWSRQRLATEPHGLSLMRYSPMFAADVTAVEIDRLTTHPAVRRIVEDGLSAPN